jgi:hypothetical protein
VRVSKSVPKLRDVRRLGGSDELKHRHPDRSGEAA